MSGKDIRERYGPYPKRKAKSRLPLKEGRFLKRSYEWLKWKIIDLKGISFHLPCLEH